MLFFFPLYYQFYKVPPPYPFKYANWVAIGYTVVGIAVTIAVVDCGRSGSTTSTASTSKTRR